MISVPNLETITDSTNRECNEDACTPTSQTKEVDKSIDFKISKKEQHLVSEDYRQIEQLNLFFGIWKKCWQAQVYFHYLNRLNYLHLLNNCNFLQNLYYLHILDIMCINFWFRSNIRNVDNCSEFAIIVFLEIAFKCKNLK